MLKKLSILVAMLLAVCVSFAVNAQPETPLYRVVFVDEFDTLNVREGTGVGYSIVGTLPSDAADIQITGESKIVGKSVWVPIEHGALVGWVNRYFLTEQVDSETFCADENALKIVDDLKVAIEAQDGEALAALVVPERGLFIRLNRWNKEVQIPQDEVETIFTDTQSRYWGDGQGSALPIDGTAAEIVMPSWEDDLLPSENAGCDEVIGGATTGVLEPPLEYEGINYFSLYRPPPDDANEFDWATWIVGIEYWDGQPYLSYLVRYKWEI